MELWISTATQILCVIHCLPREIKPDRGMLLARASLMTEKEEKNF